MQVSDGVYTTSDSVVISVVPQTVPNEPQEEYQEEKSDAPYESKLNSPYEDSKDEQKSGGNNRVMDLLKELEKERKERSAPDAIGEIKAPKDGGATSKVDDGNKTSPISGKAKGK